MTTDQSESAVTIVGAGLAGTEAAWQLAERGFLVDLYEMRPIRTTEAHHTDDFAELVCSNSFGAQSVDRAQGLLKEELRRLGSLIVRCAEKNALPAGGALAVGRESFSADVTAAILSHPNIRVRRTEVTDLPTGPTIVATGPLTSESFAQCLGELAGQNHLYFYDALAPIVTLNRFICPLPGGNPVTIGIVKPLAKTAQGG